MLHEKILLLKRGISDYSEFVEKMIEKSLCGFLNRNENALHDIIDKDEAVANKYEIEFDEICVNYIAQYQPVTKNLRMIISAVKINNDLERIADHCVNIAQNALFVIGRPFITDMSDISAMGELTVKMFKNSIKAFIDEDLTAAKSVLESDNDADALKIRITDELSALAQKDSKTVERSLKLINIAANLERIADLSTNICEDVIYWFEGEVIKHKFHNN
ncbi:MAG: phosphate signaling complex protein PhoU [Endomicrobium sp.]|jgi:phosphate transport system protein|nr:phosphate signaling complex protein PhoU [Endomicrobium sp.]